MKIESATASASIPDTPRDHRLHEAAERFEGILLGEMLKPLARKEDDSAKDGDVMQSYGVEALAGAMAHRGGLGFAHMLEQRFVAGIKNISSQG